MKSGLTLIELLVVVALIFVLAAAGAPILNTFLIRNYVSTTKTKLYSALSKAQVYAATGRGDSAWGVYRSGNTFTVFRGSSYASRTTAFDEQYTVPATVSVSGLSEIVFARLSGTTTNTGTITVQGAAAPTQTLTVYTTGVVTSN